MHRLQCGPAGLQPGIARGAAVRRTVVHDPEDASGRAVRALGSSRRRRAGQRAQCPIAARTDQRGGPGGRPTPPDRPRRPGDDTRARRAAGDREQPARRHGSAGGLEGLVFSSAEITKSCGPSGRPSQRR
jgi:hypothetical protein